MSKRSGKRLALVAGFFAVVLTSQFVAAWVLDQFRDPVRDGITVPVAIYKPEPTYSQEAKDAKREGQVTLSMLIGQTGHPRDIRVSKSLGPGFDESAIEAVKTWRFEPATKKGKPIAARVVVAVDFHVL